MSQRTSQSSPQPLELSLEDLDDSVADEFTLYGTDPFILCCLIEEEQQAPLKEADMKPFT